MKKILCGVLIVKVFLGLSIFLGLSFLGYVGATSSRDTTAIPLDKIVAIVNGDIVTQNELNTRIAMLKRQPNTSGLSIAALRKLALDGLIDTLLQLQLAQRSGIKLGGTEVDAAIARIAKGNQLSVAQLLRLVQEHEGISVKEYRKQIHDQILLGQVEQRFLGRNLVPTEEEITAVLRHPPKMPDGVVQCHVIDIVVEVPNSVSDKQFKTAKNIATKIATELRQGKTVEQITQETFEQQVRSEDLGWRKISELPTLFVKDVVKLQTGQVSDPLQAPNGFHVLKLLEKHGMATPTKFTREMAQDVAYRRKLEVAIKPWLKELRTNAYIKIN